MAEQAVRPKEQQRIASLKAIIASFERIIQSSGALLALWQQFGPGILDLLE